MSYRFRSKQKEDEELSSGKEIVYTLDLAGNFTFLNEVGERFSGYSCDEACRMNITQVVAPELADYVRHQITRTVREDGQPIEIQGIAVTPIARTRPLSNERVRCLDREFMFGTLVMSSPFGRGPG
ncbi:MAG: hypothetical protein DMF75_07375 [Acidobacteria bacterium]|nr:MAG: hypothetical protein DMF75_07375 [Acidobacteriota bacterium]